MPAKKSRITDYLQKSQHLKGCDTSTLSEIEEFAKIQVFQTNEVLISQGSTSQYIYYLINGSISVKIDGQLIYPLSTHGDIFGEMSALTGQQTSASIEVDEETELICISSAIFEKNGPASIELQNLCYRWFSLILSEKLDLTSQKAKLHEEQHARLEKQKALLAKQSDELTRSLETQRSISESLAQNIRELQVAKEELERQSIEEAANTRKLEDLNDTNQRLLQKVSILHDTDLPALQASLEDIAKSAEGGDKELIRSSLQRLNEIETSVRDVASLYHSKQAVEKKRVLLADGNRRQLIISKMALRGTGIELDVTSDLEEGRELIQENTYDLVCANKDTLELLEVAHQKSDQVKTVLMTSDSVQEYLGVLSKYPFLSNIVARNELDRSFTIKNIIATVSKLISNDVFGLEKYLSWGVEVKQHTVSKSCERGDLCTSMEEHLQHLGVRRPAISKCVLAAEELLMNAIYDAPIDVAGNHLYHQLSRTVPVELAEEHQGRFRYACDGLLVAVSVEDPFGGLGLPTVLSYLEKCYRGHFKSVSNPETGGAGHGIFQILNTSDLLVINVKPGIKTEVITFFNIDPDKAKGGSTSFHYFSL